MAVKDPHYRYFPSQERLVNVSNYMINPQYSDSNPGGWLDKHASRPRHGGYNISESYGRARTSLVGGVEASADFEMRNVRWSDETFTVSDLFSLRFPVIVKVVKGYYGNDGQQLIDGQILQVYKSCEELRVTATDSKNRTLTLPINCPLSVRLHSESHCSEQTQALSDLLKDVSFPTCIEVIGAKQKDGPTSNHLSSGLSDSRLMLREISRQKFLVANAIRKGWLDQSSFNIIPEQLKLTFRMATGIRHVTNEEWKDICGMYSRAARHLKFHLISGYDDVIYDDWISQSQPSSSSSNERRSPGFESDAEEEADESDSDSGAPPRRTTTRSRLLLQQAPLSQGSLPSLPTALRNSTTGSDPEPQLTASGSLTPSHLSTESIQPCKSTESLLPRGSVDSVTVGKETAGKKKSSMPPRLLRRKAEPRRVDTGTVDVRATEFELKSSGTKTSIVPQQSVSVPRSSSMSPSTAHVTDSVSMSRSSDDVDDDEEDSCNVDSSPDLDFDKSPWKGKVANNNRGSSNNREGQRSLGNPENLSSVTNASLDDIKNKWRKNDSGSHRRRSTDNPLLDIHSMDSHVWSPIYWSSDLCIGPSASGLESSQKIARMKRTKAQKRSAILSRDPCAYPNKPTVDRPSSLNCRSTPPHRPSTSSSFHFLDSTQSLFSSTSTELSATHRAFPVCDRINQRHQCLSSEDYGRPRERTYNDAVQFQPQPFCQVGRIADSCAGLSTPRGSTGCITTRPDYANPIKLGVGRSRKLSNGLVRMKLDQNGTVLSSGSEVIDDGYSTKGNSMTSSVETLHARRSINADRESMC